jgi:hypothetical protein
VTAAPSLSAPAAALAALRTLPAAVQDALAQALARPGPNLRPWEPAPGWRLVPDAARGWRLLESRSGAARPWAAGDRCGVLHLVAAWDAVALQAAWFRLPAGRWLELRPRSTRHALWGTCDALRLPEEAGRGGTERTLGCLPALDYAALRWLPAFDRPLALPPGAGSAVLNFLALLAALQGVASLAYRGPYPSPALFAALCGSFATEGDPVGVQARFTAGQTALAFRGELVESPVRWRPAPFAPLRPRPELLLHWREGIETAWVRDVPFRRALPGGAGLPCGARVWAEGAGWALGPVLLGRPAARLYRLDADGAVLQAASLEPEPPSGVPGPGRPLDPRWAPVLVAWVTLQAHPALAVAVAGLEEDLRPAWHALPLRMADGSGAALRIQAALAAEFGRRRADEDAAALAMMLVSDVLEVSTPVLLRQAQAALEAAPLPADPAALIAAGEAAQAAARERLESSLPALAAALARGEALPEA